MELPTALTSVIDQGIEFIYSLKVYVEPTLIFVPDFIRGHIETLSEAIGFDVETLNYTLGLFLCYPLAMIMNALPFGKIRHIFSFLLGVFLLQFTLGVQWIHQLVTSLVVYGMCLVLSPKTLTRAVPFFVMTYLTLGHLHRQYINYLGFDLDFTGTQMVLTQKLIMIAYNIYDGELLAKGSDNRAAKKCSQFALQKVPGIVEFLGYTFCFSNILSGPASEFSSYCSTCDGSVFYKPDGTPRGKKPSNVWPTLRALLMSLVCMALYVVLGGIFPMLDPVDPQKNTPVILTESFLEKPMLLRFGYVWMALLAFRQKYYFAWKNAEGANNLWYAGFDGFDDDGKVIGWQNCNNMNMIGFETAYSLSTLSKEWNRRTSLWLTRYVYIRTGGSLVATYSMSAFWHGFYPGYYLFFMSIPLLTMCERIGRKKISPHFSPDFWTPYDIVCRIVTSLAAEYSVTAFALLALDRSIACWRSFYFLGHIIPLLFFVVVSQFPTPKKKEA